MHDDVVHPAAVKEHGFAGKVVADERGPMDAVHVVHDASGVVIGHRQKVEVGQIGQPFVLQEAARVSQVGVDDVDRGVHDNRNGGSGDASMSSFRNPGGAPSTPGPAWHFYGVPIQNTRMAAPGRPPKRGFTLGSTHRKELGCHGGRHLIGGFRSRGHHAEGTGERFRKLSIQAVGHQQDVHHAEGNEPSRRGGV